MRGAEMTMMWPGYELVIESSGEWVEPGREPDPTWRFVDDEGHGHLYDDGYPTLRWVPVPCTLGHGDDCDSEGYWECAVCGEHVVPSNRLAKAVFIAGPNEYRLTARNETGSELYVFGEEQWKALNEAVRSAVDQMLSGFVVERNYSL